MKIVVVAIVLLPLAAASAATITVNTTGDNTAAGDGRCTLREALANVNAAADTTAGDCIASAGAGDTIGFNVPMPATITLPLGELQIQRDVEITTPAPNMLQIDGMRQSRVFNVAAGTTSMVNLTIQNGVASGNGGGIYNAGTLHLTGCALIGNQGFYRGGGIYNAGDVATLTNCIVKKNTVSDYVDQYGSVISYGGGIYNQRGSLTLVGCTLDGNRARTGGGGLLNDGNAGGQDNTENGIATLTNCLLTRNQLRDDTASGIKSSTGGGILNVGIMAADHCSIDRNVARAVGSDGLGEAFGGGIYTAGTLALTDSTVTRNLAVSGGRFATGITLGGGVDDNSNQDTDTTMTRCTIDHNVARVLGNSSNAGRDAEGGGIFANGGVTMINCTIANNQVRGCTSCFLAGGALRAWSGTATNCTFSGNRAPRIGSRMAPFDRGGALWGGMTMINSIIANYGTTNCVEGIGSGGHNLDSDGSCFAKGGSDLPHTNPRLGPLGNNGGPTQTMLLKPGSPAIDAGDDSVTGPPDNLTTDQRGLPRLSGAHVDIGAYEVQ